MSLANTSLSILWPALVAGLLVTATHVPLGMQVLRRGIVFIDLAVAQVAGVGVILAETLGWELEGVYVQVVALAAALGCALLLTWTERRWPEVQEAIIGTVFVLGSSVALLLLAHNPHGGEHLKDLLVGQILWVPPSRLVPEALVCAAILAALYFLRGRSGRLGFYLLFACAVTDSVQLAGLYLVFSTLVMPALATWYVQRRRLAMAYGVGAIGYALGLAVSLAADLPSGAAIVCAMAVVGAACFALSPRGA